MARPTIFDLRRLGGAFDAEPYIESHDDALREATSRYNAITRALTTEQGLFNRAEAERLRQLMLPHLSARKSFSQAQPLQVREWRLAAVEQLWRLTVETGIASCRSWTAIRPSWIYSPEELGSYSAQQLTEQFRGLLNRHGAAESDGWLLGKLDCEFDPRNRLHRFHLHGAACGGMVEVLDRMRASAAFRPHRSPALEGRRVARPIQISRLVMNNLPMPLSYILKGQFTARWLGLNPEGQVKRGNRPMRIPEPYGTQALLWLDRQGLSDMFVMLNLSVRQGNLVIRA